MRLEEIEKMIDEAIEEGDFKRVAELLDEREKVLKEMGNLPAELAEELLKRDEERMEKIKNMMDEFKDAVIKSREYKKSLQAFRNAHGDQEKRSWGRG